MSPAMKRSVRSAKSMRSVRSMRSERSALARELDNFSMVSAQTVVVKPLHPVDKGWAWFILLGAFGINFLTVGYMRSFGILFVEFQRVFESSSAMTSVISGVQSLSYSITTLIVMNIIIKHMKVRTICLIGSFVEFCGTVLSSRVPDAPYLIVTQGIIYGSGQAMLYCPMVLILSEYFDKKRPIVTVLSSCGINAGGMVFPLLTRSLLDTYSLRGGLLVLAAVILNQAVFSALFTPPSDYYPAAPKYQEEKKEPLSRLTSVIEVEENGHDKKIEENGDIKHKLHDDKDAQILPKENGSIVDNQVSIKRLSGETGVDVLEKSAAEREVLVSGQKLNVEILPEIKETEILITPNPSDPSGQETQSNKADQISITDSKSPAIRLRHRYETQLSNSRFMRGFSNLDLNLTPPRVLRQISIVSDTSDPPASPTADSYVLSRPQLYRKPSLMDSVTRVMSTSSIDLFGSIHNMSFHRASLLRQKRRLRQQGIKDLKVVDIDEVELLPSAPKKGPCPVPDMMRSRIFWLTAAFFGAGSIAASLPNVFIPPLTKEKGMNDEQVTLFLMVLSLTEMTGRIIPGLVLHFELMRPSTVVIGPMIAGFVLYQFIRFFTTFGSLIALVIMAGLCSGTFGAVNTLVVIELIGLENLGPALGFFSIVTGICNGVSYPIAGTLYDTSGSYAASFHYFGAMYLVGALIIIFVQVLLRRKNAGAGMASILGDFEAESSVGGMEQEDISDFIPEEEEEETAEKEKEEEKKAEVIEDKEEKKIDLEIDGKEADVANAKS